MKGSKQIHKMNFIPSTRVATQKWPRIRPKIMQSQSHRLASRAISQLWHEIQKRGSPKSGCYILWQATNFARLCLFLRGRETIIPEEAQKCSNPCSNAGKQQRKSAYLRGQITQIRARIVRRWTIMNVYERPKMEYSGNRIRTCDLRVMSPTS